VCGVAGHRQELTRASQDIEVFAPGMPYHSAIPAQTEVVLAFSHRGLGVIASYLVDTDRRAELRATEERFLGSFRCMP
jgi:hypothetical protein